MGMFCMANLSLLVSKRRRDNAVNYDLLNNINTVKKYTKIEPIIDWQQISPQKIVGRLKSRNIH